MIAADIAAKHNAALPANTPDAQRLSTENVMRAILPDNPAQLSLDITPPENRKVVMPSRLGSTMNTVIFIDTGFVIDLVQNAKFGKNAAQIIQQLAANNPIVIPESTWKELMTHHNLLNGNQREIPPETMWVLKTIHDKQASITIPPADDATSATILSTYREEFAGDSRKYVKDPLGVNDEELMNQAINLAKQGKRVVVMSPDAHVVIPLKAIGQKGVSVLKDVE
jgi:hypothetical protein